MPDIMSADDADMLGIDPGSAANISNAAGGAGTNFFSSMGLGNVPTSLGGSGFSPAGINFGGLGQAGGSIFSGIGSFQSAAAYDAGADFADVEAKVAKENTNLQEFQYGRKLNMILGSQSAAAGANNLQTTGSAMSLMRSAQQQGALQKATLQVQGNVQVAGYQEQAAQLRDEASAARTAGTGGILGGIIGGIASIFSDMRLKDNVTHLYTREDGISVYSFSYKGSTDTWVGAVAQDVQRVRPDAVYEEDGFLKVDYGAIDMKPEKAV